MFPPKLRRMKAACGAWRTTPRNQRPPNVPTAPFNPRMEVVSAQGFNLPVITIQEFPPGFHAKQVEDMDKVLDAIRDPEGWIPTEQLRTGSTSGVQVTGKRKAPEPEVPQKRRHIQPVFDISDGKVVLRGTKNEKIHLEFSEFLLLLSYAHEPETRLDRLLPQPRTRAERYNRCDVGEMQK